MIWLNMIGISILAAMILMFEMAFLIRSRKKERMSLVVITSLGWLLAILLLIYPQLPGPVKLIDALYKPLASYLK